MLLFPPPPPRRETTVHLFEVPIVLELVVVERLVFRSRAFVGDENARRFFHPSSRDGIIHFFFFLVFQVRNVRPSFFEFLSTNFSFFCPSFHHFLCLLCFCKNCGAVLLLFSSLLLLVSFTTRDNDAYTTNKQQKHTCKIVMLF